jgi:hypothetical protein
MGAGFWLGRFSNGHCDTWLNLRLRSLFSHQPARGWWCQCCYLLTDSLFHKELGCRIHNAVSRPVYATGCEMELPVGGACLVFPKEPTLAACNHTWKNLNIWRFFNTKLGFCMYYFLCFSSDTHAYRGKITNLHKCWKMAYTNTYLEIAL